MLKTIRSTLFIIMLATLLCWPAPIFAQSLFPSTCPVTLQPKDTLVTISAVIRELRGYDRDHEHQHMIVNRIKVLSIKNGNAFKIPQRAFVAIRVDRKGIGKPIPGLKVGAPIVIKGEFIPKGKAQSRYNCCDAVIHFTHDPKGYVIYHGVRYK